jgi:hypothetical protein
MQAGGLAHPRGGVHIHRILSLLLDVARGLRFLHACGHEGGDVDPSQVWLQLQDSEDVGAGTHLSSIDEDSIDTGAQLPCCLRGMSHGSLQTLCLCMCAFVFFKPACVSYF